jgi:hypothetical protein
MPNTNVTTSGVFVQFTLSTSTASAPFNMTGCQGQVNYSDGSYTPFYNWAAAVLGTLDPNGADLAITVVDSSYSASSNVTSVANWAITFIPRGANATSQSPVGNNQSTITGSSATDPANNGQFVLPLTNVKIKNSGDFDWMLMIQMVMSDGDTIKCFASDPEMEVGS